MSFLSIDDCKNVARSKGGKCLSSQYTNNNTKMLWSCKHGHRWSAVFSSIKNNGTWCPECAGRTKYTMQMCHNIAKEKAGECLSAEYVNMKTKMQWKCSRGHVFWTDLDHVVHQKVWCPVCAGKTPITIQDCMAEAKKKGGRCLSTKYLNIDTKMLWECEYGHQWETTFDKIKNRGRWCHKCPIGKTQRRLTGIIEKLFSGYKVYSNYRGFSWLKTRKNWKQEIDIWVPHVKLAIEYDGKQHFAPVQFGGISLARAKQNLKETQRRDRMKNKKIAQNRKDIECFIRFNYEEDISVDNVKDKIGMMGIII